MDSKPMGLANEVRSVLEFRCGGTYELFPLKGVAGHGAIGAHSEKGSAIVKLSSSVRERMFYEHYADHLRMAGIRIPELYGSGCDPEGIQWIVIEEIPHSLDKSLWSGHPRQIEYLAIMHQVTLGNHRPSLEGVFYQPGWNTVMTEQAATWFEHSAHRLDIMAHLKESQYAGQSLFTHWCWLSGDTNPTNWRVYDEEEWVLTDWERFCTGHPAIDLGITMPGLGSMDMSLERNIAAQYVRRCSDLCDDLALSEIKLAHQIRLAKLWSAVEFLANAAQLSIEYSKTTIEHLIEFLPELLLRTVSSDHV